MKIFFKFLCLTFLLVIMNTNIFAQVNVNPGGGSYATLKAAFDAINAGTHTGSVTVDITSSTVEPLMAILNASGVGAASYTSVVITTSNGAGVTVAGSDTATIKLAGADNVTIDGRVGGSGRKITVSNSSILTGGTAVWLAHGGYAATDSAGAKKNTVRNLEISCGIAQNGSTTSTNGVLVSGTLRTGQGRNNDSNKILENRIIKARNGINIIGGGATNLNDDNSIVSNIVGPTAFGADQIGQIGIFVQFQNRCNIEKNTVQFVGGDFANTTAGADRIGIGLGQNAWTSTTTSTTTNSNNTVKQNIVHDVIEERTFSAVGIVVGTTLSGPKTDNLIYNNSIYNIRANATPGDQAIGIGHCGGPGDKIVFNSISMTGDLDPGAITSSSTNPVAAGISKHLAAAADTAVFIKNNSILLDVSTNTTSLLKAAIIGPAAGYAFGSGGFDYNDYYVPTPGTNGQVTGITGTGTTSFTTLVLWQGAYTPGQDANSKQCDPLYASVTANLQPGPGSCLYHAGTPVSGIVDDINKTPRNGSTPTIGAYEDTASINFPPLIANTSLSNTFITGNRALNGVAITDANGVASGANAPRVYWKVNSGSWFSAATSSGTSPYDFTIGTLGLSVGDTVKFFVIAQDITGLVAANPGLGLVATSVNSITTFPSNPNSYMITNNPNFGNGAGYFYANSTSGASGQPSQPQFCWRDTSGSTTLCANTVNAQSGIYTGTSLDDGYWKVLLPVGKKVRFFATDFDTVRIGTNGIIAFQNYDPSFGAGNHNPPVGGIPGGTVLNAFYPLWWDANFGTSTPSATSRVSYKVVGGQLIITYDRAPRFSGVAGDYVSYQVCIDVSAAPASNSRITLQIADTTGGRTGSVFYSNYTTNAMLTHLTGLQNSSGTAALTYRFRNTTTVLVDGPYFNTPIGSLAVEFGPDNTKLNSSCKTLNLTFRLEAIQLTRKDTVTVSLVDSTDLATIQSKSVVYDSTTGTATLSYDLAQDSPARYYIKLFHRNSIITYSNPVSFSSSTLNYDFTSDVCQALGCNQAMIEVAGRGVIPSIFSGNPEQDDCVDLSDGSAIDNDVYNFACADYLITDLNYDGCTDLTDAAYWDNNAFNFVCVFAPTAPASAPAIIEPSVFFNYKADETYPDAMNKEEFLNSQSGTSVEEKKD